jgi:putative methyltransferase (TIGR04325 family)
LGSKQRHVEWLTGFNSYSEAIKMGSAYDDDHILQKCKEAALKVKNSEAVYQRDSIVFNRIEYSWGLLSGLQRAALENNGELCVLDFGGGLGSSFYQNAGFLSTLKNLKWCVVEQRNFVDCGKEDFETDDLKFYYTMDECLTKHTPNVLLLSGVLQYLNNPYQWLDKFLRLDIPYIILDRTAFAKSDNEILAVQNVHESIYKAKLVHLFFNREKLLDKLKSYNLIADFRSCADASSSLPDGTRIFWDGLILKKK